MPPYGWASLLLSERMQVARPRSGTQPEAIHTVLPGLVMLLRQHPALVCLPCRETAVGRCARSSDRAPQATRQLHGSFQ